MSRDIELKERWKNVVDKLSAQFSLMHESDYPSTYRRHVPWAGNS